jgi:hypothetical protein
MLQIATEGRVADTLDQKKVSELPIPQRDVYALPKLSSGATFIPGAANSTKLTNSPVVTVNGNRYRGNNYVLDGAMNSNSNNSGEPAIVPSIESIEEAQVQTNNFSSEFGRDNGAVINLQTKSGTNQFHGRLWEFHRNAALNARNFFATSNPPLVFNQFGGNMGGPIFKDKTFFFGSYEGARNAAGRVASFQVETPQLRDFVNRTAPNSIANQLLIQFGAPALPPDALQGVVQPSNKIGEKILYGIPAPFNPDFGRGLNAQGGVNTPPGQNAIRPTGFVVNPTIKTQYSVSWFLNLQREVWNGLIVEAGYTGTRGVNLERIDDVNRFAGDLLDGREDRINPNFSMLLFVTNGVNSSYQAMTLEARRNLSKRFSLQANYRWSKWLDTSSDTSTGQFADNSEPGKGAVNVDCLRCERGRSLFDIPHRFSAQLLWLPGLTVGNKWLSHAVNGWQVAAIFTRQSGRPFSVWNGAAPNIILLIGAKPLRSTHDELRIVACGGRQH